MKTLFLILFFIFAGCEKMDPGTVGATATEKKSPLVTAPVETQNEKSNQPLIESVSLPNILFHGGSEKSLLINVEVADTPDARRIGLMNRNGLNENYGMLFVFEKEMQDPFWMKDTHISLDLIFLDKNYNVVDLLENAEPESERLLFSKTSYRYVLEVNGGTAKKQDIRVGDQAEFRLGPK